MSYDREDHEIDIHVETTRIREDGDHTFFAEITFTSEGRSVKMEYEGEKLGDVFSHISEDITSCIVWGRAVGSRCYSEWAPDN